MRRAPRVRSLRGGIHTLRRDSGSVKQKPLSDLTGKRLLIAFNYKDYCSKPPCSLLWISNTGHHFGEDRAAPMGLVSGEAGAIGASDKKKSPQEGFYSGSPKWGLIYNTTLMLKWGYGGIYTRTTSENIRYCKKLESSPRIVF